MTIEMFKKGIKSCFSCTYFHNHGSPNQQIEFAVDGSGECRRYAPLSSGKKIDVSLDDWCGEHQICLEICYDPDIRISFFENEKELEEFKKNNQDMFDLNED